MAGTLRSPTTPLCRPCAKSGSSTLRMFFTGPLIELMETIRRDNEQTIDHDNLDTLLRAQWAGDVAEKRQSDCRGFRGVSAGEPRRDRGASRSTSRSPPRRSHVTLAMVKDVLAKLTEDRPRLAPLVVWRAYAHLDDYKGKAAS